MFKNITLLAILALLAAGCGGVSEKTIELVLDKDPSFARALEVKENANSKIALLRENLKAQKIEIVEEIKIQKNKITPLIDEISAALREARIEYGKAKAALKERLAKLKSIRSLLLKKNKLALTGDEISVWNRRAEELDREINSLKSDLDKLSARTELLKTEIKILKN